MATELFIPKRFKATSIVLIEKSLAIINRYMDAGLTLTVRQLYYRLVAADIIPNNKPSYDKLKKTISDARLAGLIDWDAIEDRTRYLREIQHFESPSEALRNMHYAEDLWRDQDDYIEIWIEKDALVGVIEDMCNQWRVPYYSCRGYSSQSLQYAAGKRIADKLDGGKSVTIYHLGDHDPSGVDMTRDNRIRLDMFANSAYPDDAFEFKRIALTMDQIRQYNPPPNYAKESDVRTRGYIDDTGSDECWELDALEPTVLTELVGSTIEQHLDMDKFNARLAEERQHRSEIRAISRNWNVVSHTLKDRE